MVNDNVFEVETPMGKRIRLTKERFRHIVEVHPIILGKTKEIEAALEHPNEIITSVRDPKVWIYYRKSKKLIGRYLAVVVKVLNGVGFVMTGYITDRIKLGELVWLD